MERTCAEIARVALDRRPLAPPEPPARDEAPRDRARLWRRPRAGPGGRGGAHREDPLGRFVRAQKQNLWQQPFIKPDNPKRDTRDDFDHLQFRVHRASSLTWWILCGQPIQTFTPGE